MKEITSSRSLSGGSTTKSTKISETEYYFSIQEEVEKTQEESLSRFLNEEGIFEVNLTYSLKNLD